MQKARRHLTKRLRPLVSVWFQVLFHSVVHGTFHLSLTVLVHYRSHSSIQPCRMDPADSDRIPRVPPYSGYYLILTVLLIRDYHPLWLNFPVYSNSQLFSSVVLQPRHCLNNIGLGSFLFARHYSGNHYCFLFLSLIRCFSSRGLLPFGYLAFS